MQQVHVALASVLVAASGAGLTGCSDSGGGGSSATVAPVTSGGGSAAPTSSSSGGGTTAQPPAAPRGELRGLWVTRWSAADEAAIRDAIALAKQHGLNALVLQCYGDAMALYPSSVAPRSTLGDPSFDQLATAIRLARAEGLEVHAWLNVVKVWAGGLGSPRDPGHIVAAHPEWAMVDGAGRSTIQNVGVSGSTVFFCPRQPGFVRYLRDLVTELGARYPDLDGVHLDYIRYPGVDVCYCALHRADFRAAFGRDPQASDPDFVAWRYDDVTRLVTHLHDDLEAVAPDMALTAAVFPRSGQVFQDTYTWLRRGLLDAVLPMIYTADTAEFEDRVRAWRQRSGGRLVVPGIDCGRGQVGPQIAAARRQGAHGFALFASSTFDAAARAETLAATGGRPEPTPPMPWRDGTRDGEAPLVHSVTPGGTTRDAAVVTWATDEATTGELAVTAQGGAVEVFAATSAAGFEHRATATRLAPGTAYAFEVRARDAAGNLTTATGSFTTPAGAPGPVVVDDGGAGFATQGGWTPGSSSGGHDGDYLYASARAQGSAAATWVPALAQAGSYEVAVHYVHGTNRSSEVAFTVTTATGPVTVRVDQTQPGPWRVLGTFALDPATAQLRLTNTSASAGVVIADAARFTPR